MRSVSKTTTTMNLLVFWKRLINIGVEKELSFYEKRQVRLTNLFSFYITCSFLIYFFMNLWMQDWILIIMSFSFCLIYLIPLIQNYYQNNKVSHLSFIVFSNFLLLILCWIFGSQIAAEYYFLVTAIAPVLFYVPRKQTYWLFALSVVFFIVAQLIFFNVEPLITYPIFKKFYYLNLFTLFVLMFLVVTAFTNDHLANERVVQQKNIDLQESYASIKLLSEAGFQLNSTLSLDNIFEIIHQVVLQFMQFDVLLLGLYEPNQQCLKIEGIRKNGEKIPSHIHDLAEEHIPGIWSIIRQEAFLMNDYQAEYAAKIGKGVPPSIQEAQVQSVMYIPLVIKRRVLGVIAVHSAQKKAYSDYQFNLLKSLVVYITIAIDNARIYAEVENKNEEIASINKDLTDSINYARRIQRAILPEMTEIRTHLPESFVFYEPRDTVSGDFYWFGNTESKPIYEKKLTFDGEQLIFKEFEGEKIVLAAVDCTGHGVPGALLSMVGNELLNEIVITHHITSPERILDEMNVGIKKALRQEATQIEDGMDMGLVVIDKEAQVLEFAGAKNNLVYFQENELHIVKGDRKSIGGSSTSVKNYTKHRVCLSNDDGEKIITEFYLFSDGFGDQFGGSGKYGKKFLTKKLHQLLQKHHNEPMPEQFRNVKQAFYSWKEGHHQTDDVLLLGARC
ncbi:hypothetical protein BKI52_01665 [marine bacterium AO1-C]|nr:hypothetical protein BKI52_01665 [marine bacterium AO1-C]